MNERFCDFVPYSIEQKNVTNVRYSFGTKLTSLELDWACDMTHAVCDVRIACLYYSVSNITLKYKNVQKYVLH